MNHLLQMAHSRLPDCSRNRSGQSILKRFRTTALNKAAATHSIKSSYFLSVSTCFNKSLNLVRDQGVGGSNPLSPTKFAVGRFM